MDDPTSDTGYRSWVSSPGGAKEPKLGVSPAPPPAHEALPERYGIPLLELLVVDTAYLFVSWEITPEQLAQAQSAMGGEAGLRNAGRPGLYRGARRNAWRRSRCG